MNTRTKSLLLSLLLLVFAAAAQAGQVIVIADLDRGVALVPEGTDFPNMRINGRDGKPLVFVHASDDVFASARNTIATTKPQATMEKTILTYQGPAVPHGPRVQSEKQFRAATDDSDTTYYITFYDGSWISARRIIISYGSVTNYDVRMEGFAADNDYYDGWIYLDQSSAENPGFDVTAYCSIGSSGGSCYTPTYGYSATGYFSAHVVCYGNIHQHRLPICGRYGEPPCSENLSGTIDIYFP